MVQYRRNLLPGGTYFFTVTLHNRRATYLTDHIELLRNAMRQTAQRRPFQTHAIVILPDHLHAIWTLPPADNDYPARWRSIKANVSRDLAAQGIKIDKTPRGEYLLWQKRYWEHTIQNDDDFRRHVDYIHYNPVKHGLVNRVADWPYSSFHRHVARGELPEDWGGSGIITPGNAYGEPP